MAGCDGGDRSRGDLLGLSLGCLAHPASLLCIALLLLNDHYLKSAFPSWWTGKLSDCAGLLFFPFLVTASLAVVTPARAARIAGWLAAGLTGVGFAALKTAAGVNAAAAGIAEGLLGTPVSMVRDPSDLIALCSLGGAIALWERQLAQRPPQRRSSRRGWPALVVASLGAAATSLAPQAFVVQIVEDQSAVYALVGHERFDLREQRRALELADLEVYRLRDAGHSWERTDLDATSLAPGPISLEPLPLALENPASPGERFTLTRLGRIEKAVPGARAGEIRWEVDWEIPASRRSFLERRSGPLVLHHALFPSRQPGVLLVAAGRHGVLERSPSGEWSAHRVHTAELPPLYETDAEEVVSVLLAEYAILVSLMLVSALVLAALAWVSIGRGARASVRPVWSFFGRAVGAILVGNVVFVFAVDRLSGRAWELVPVALLVATPILYLVALIVPWRRSVALAANPAEAASSRSAWWKTSLCLGLAPMLALSLWPPGIVPRYELALALAAFAWIATLGLGGRAMLAHARRSRISGKLPQPPAGR